MIALIIIGIALFLLGVYLILAALKNWHKDYIPRKFLAKLIKKSLDPLAYRYLKGLTGAIIIMTVLSFTYLLNRKTSTPVYKTDRICAKYIKGQEPNHQSSYQSPLEGSDCSSSLTLFFEKKKIVSLKKDFEKFDSVSFKNNYMDEIPDFIFKMKNLEVLNLTNNSLENLPVSNLKVLRKLRKIILVNNPIDSVKIASATKELNIKIMTTP